MTISPPPIFFVPHAEDAAQAERVWEATVEFMRQLGHDVFPRRIYSIRYHQDGKDCFDCVGGKDRYGTEEILVLLETPSVFLCCTANRGVVRGEPSSSANATTPTPSISPHESPCAKKPMPITMACRRPPTAAPDDRRWAANGVGILADAQSGDEMIRVGADRGKNTNTVT